MSRGLILGIKSWKLGFRFCHSLAADEFHRTAAREILREKIKEDDGKRTAWRVEATRVRKDMEWLRSKSGQQRGRTEKKVYEVFKYRTSIFDGHKVLSLHVGGYIAHVRYLPARENH